MRSTLTAGLLLFASLGLGAVPATDVYLPAIGHGPGNCVGGVCTVWRSDVWIFNPSTAEASVEISYLQLGAENLDPARRAVTVAPGETKEVLDIVGTLFGLDNSFGAARFVSSRPVVVTGRIYDANVVTNRGTGTAGQFFAALPAEAAIRRGMAADVIGAAQDAAGIWRTNFGFVETTGSSATIDVQRLDASGVVLARKTYVLRGREPRQFSILDIGGPAGTNQRLNFRVIDGDGRILTFGSRIDNRTGDPSTIQMSVAPTVSVFSAPTQIAPMVVPSRSAFLPAVGHGPGGCFGGVCTEWRSDVWIFNSSSTTANVEVFLLSRDNENVDPPRRSLTIAPNETRELEDVVGSVFGLDNAFGALEIMSNVEVVMTGRIFDANVVTNRGTGTAGQFFAGIPANVAIGGDQWVDLIGLAQDEGDTWRTNIGFLETTGNAATIEIQRLDGMGNVLGATALGLRPREPKQFSITNVGGPAGINQRVRVRIAAGSGRVVAFGSRLDNRTGDPSTIEMTTSTSVSGARTGAALVRLNMPIPERARPTFLQNRSTLVANGFTLAADGSSISFPDAPAANWRVRFGAEETAMNQEGRFTVNLAEGGPSFGLIFDPVGDFPLGTVRVQQLAVPPANPTPIVLSLMFSTPCRMSGPGFPELANCDMPAGTAEHHMPEKTFPPTRREDSCGQLDGFIRPSVNVPGAALIAYFGSTCQKRVVEGCCANEGGWLIDPKTICCVKNHKGRFCQELSPGDLEVTVADVVDLGVPVAVRVHNNSCFGDTQISRVNSPNLGGSLIGDGLEGGPGKYLLRHYDKDKVNAIDCFKTDPSQAPRDQVAAWVGDRVLTYTLPKCMDILRSRETDHYNFGADTTNHSVNFKLNRDSLWKLVGDITVFSLTNAGRDGWRIAQRDVGCDGLHLHGNHPCSGAADPNPMGCGHGKVEKVP